MTDQENNDTLSLLIKAASSGHGRTLQPSQVSEVVDIMMGLDYQGRQMAAKVEALTRLVYCMLVSRAEDIDGEFVVPPFQMTDDYYEAQDYERGFTLDWDEETGIITVALGEAAEEGQPEPVGLSAVPEDELAAGVGDSSEPSLP